MKKTLAAVAVLGAFAGSALAADVTLYGIVDTGFAYSHTDLDVKGQDATDKFSMESGQQSGSRIGFKGTEDLGNGLTVGFVLENGFTSDDGAEKGVFFDREASLFLQGAFGKVAFGKIGSINNGTSSWGKVGMLNAFGTSWGNSSLSNLFHLSTVYDNTIAYETPSFAGFKVYAQYSMGSTKSEDTSNQDFNKWTAAETENESSTDRYYVIGATYNNGPIAAYLAVDSINYKSWTTTWKETTSDSSTTITETTGAKDTDDSLTVTLGGSYDFEVVKVYFGAQYFDEVSGKKVEGSYSAGKSTGYALNLSADAPVAGGKAMFGVGYYDASEADSVAKGSEFDVKRYIVSAGYTYPFSKRTNAYAVANYMQDKYEQGTTKLEPSVYSVMFGLRHQF